MRCESTTLESSSLVSMTVSRCRRKLSSRAVDAQRLTVRLRALCALVLVLCVSFHFPPVRDVVPGHAGQRGGAGPQVAHLQPRGSQEMSAHARYQACCSPANPKVHRSRQAWKAGCDRPKRSLRRGRLGVSRTPWANLRLPDTMGKAISKNTWGKQTFSACSGVSHRVVASDQSISDGSE